MYKALLVLLLLAAPVAAAEVPTVNIPPQLWCRNYKGGSCVHASAVMLWRWQGHYEWADYWKRQYAYGENARNFHARCDKEGVTYCDTYGQDDVTFLEWAVRTRRGCLVAISNGPLYGYNGTIAHAVCLVHLDKNVAGILDNNDVGQGAGNITWVRRDAFIRDWKRSGSWAWSPVASPPAPPKMVRPRK